MLLSLIRMIQAFRDYQRNVNELSQLRASRAPAITRAPSAASPRVIARPMPLLAPVRNSARLALAEIAGTRSRPTPGPK